jgi:hypothetical protein
MLKKMPEVISDVWDVHRWWIKILNNNYKRSKVKKSNKVIYQM